MRHEELERHGLEDYAQWIARLVADGHITDTEAEMLLEAREATIRVISVDDFSPGKLTNAPPASKNRAGKKSAASKKTGAGGKTVRGGKAASAKNNAPKKKRATKKTADK